MRFPDPSYEKQCHGSDTKGTHLQVSDCSQKTTDKTKCLSFNTKMSREVSELSVPVPWGEIRGKVWGPDHGRPVLCLHGWADNCGSFNSLIPLLPTECRYVALDLVGHGRSSHRLPGAFYSTPDYVVDVRLVADALQLKKFSIIGHSMGGDVAAMFTALYPEMVDALILLDAFGFLPTDSTEIAQVMRQGIVEMLQYEKKAQEKKRIYSYEKAVERLQTANPALSERSVHVLLERGLAQVEGGFVFSRDLRVNFKNIVRLSLEQNLELQSRIKAPVLVVLAEEGSSRGLSEPAQQKYIKTILQCLQDRNRSVVKIPGDHHIHLNKPEVVAPSVCDFLYTKVLSQPISREHKL